VTTTELRKLQQAHERATQRYRQTGDARNAAVLAALKEGWTHARIAETLGISRGRVAAIKQHATKEDT
jgi:DNA-binding NarL/FixJ family response regulator